MRNPKLTKRRRQQIVALYRAGKTGPEVADKLGVSFGWVYQVLRQEKTPCRERERKEPLPPKLPEPRVVDKILDYLRMHPQSTVEKVARGVKHSNQATVGQLLSRLGRDGLVVADSRRGAFRLWSVSPAV